MNQAARRNREIPADRAFNQVPTSPTNAQGLADADADDNDNDNDNDIGDADVDQGHLPPWRSDYFFRSSGRWLCNSSGGKMAPGLLQ